MSDLRTLADAFDELARRGDAAATMPYAPPRRAERRWSQRLVPVSIAAVAARLATSVALLGSGDAGPPVSPPATDSTRVPSSETPDDAVPATPDALADRFRDVLGDTGTFVVTETGTPVLDTLPPIGGSGGTTSTPQAGTPVGATITVSGVTGGFALTVYTGNPDNEIGCDDPAACSVTQLDDGSTLYTDTTELAGPDGGTTHHVVLIHPDGVTLDMHVSDQRSPKGATDRIAPHPPLDTTQITGILTSERW